MTTPAHPRTTPAMIFPAMSVASGLAVSNLYYNQPLLGLIDRSFPGAHASFVATATQLGYAVGLVLLVPLGDMLNRRRLIVAQFLGIALFTTVAAMAPTATALIAASLLLGCVATVAQQILPFAAEMAPNERRGAVMGKVMSGLLCGILLSRVLSGFIGAWAGWRAMFWLGVPLAIAGAGLMAITLPRQNARPRQRYCELLRSLRQLWNELPDLRAAAITQGLLFGSFSVFWNVLALHLQEPHYGLGPQAAGLFGLVGVAGVLVAPYAGRLADRNGPRSLMRKATVGLVGAWALLLVWPSLGGMVIGIVLLDLAYHTTVISSQHIVYALRPDARSRINTLFVGTIFAGGTLGSIIAQTAWQACGWPAVSFGGITLAAAGLLFQSRLQHRSR